MKNGIFFYTKLYLTNSALPDYPYFHAHSPDIMPTLAEFQASIEATLKEARFAKKLARAQRKAAVHASPLRNEDEGPSPPQIEEPSSPSNRPRSFARGNSMKLPTVFGEDKPVYYDPDAAPAMSLFRLKICASQKRIPTIDDLSKTFQERFPFSDDEED